ncbi:hypothetical protein YC2023_007424 [Brassica napus]
MNAKPRTNLSCSSQACLTLVDMGEEAMDEIPFRQYCISRRHRQDYNHEYREIERGIRSSVRPTHDWPIRQKLFTLDVLYFPDKPNPDNCPQGVYGSLVDAVEHVSDMSNNLVSCISIRRSRAGLVGMLSKHLNGSRAVNLVGCPCISWSSWAEHQICPWTNLLIIGRVWAVQLGEVEFEYYWVWAKYGCGCFGSRKIYAQLDKPIWVLGRQLTALMAPIWNLREASSSTKDVSNNVSQVIFGSKYLHSVQEILSHFATYSLNGNATSHLEEPSQRVQTQPLLHVMRI